MFKCPGQRHYTSVQCTYCTPQDYLDQLKNIYQGVSSQQYRVEQVHEATVAETVLNIIFLYYLLFLFRFNYFSKSNS